MVSGSRRHADSNAERQLAAFLDRNFYRELEKTNVGMVCQRQHDSIIQRQGIDVIIEHNGQTLFIDEKASLYYSNAMINTFAFEVDSIQTNDGDIYEGWLLDERLSTTYYLLIWTNIRCDYDKSKNIWVRREIGHLSTKDFSVVEVFLISRAKLINFLYGEGWTKETIRQKSAEIRQKGKGGRINIDNDNMYFFYSDNLAEKPVNLIIKKHKLKKIADRIYLISQAGTAVVKGKGAAA